MERRPAELQPQPATGSQFLSVHQEDRDRIYHTLWLSQQSHDLWGLVQNENQAACLDIKNFKIATAEN